MIRRANYRDLDAINIIGRELHDNLWNINELYNESEGK